jgi:hypothetical protein
MDEAPLSTNNAVMLNEVKHLIVMQRFNSEMFRCAQHDNDWL